LVKLPLPDTLLQITWLLISFTFGRAFAKSLDQSLQQTDAFKKQNKFMQVLAKNGMNFLHHFWMGLVLMVYAADLAAILGISGHVVLFFGLGLFIDDLPDVSARFKKYFSSFFGVQVAPDK
jgi:hypothetical protein